MTALRGKQKNFEIDENKQMLTSGGLGTMGMVFLLQSERNLAIPIRMSLSYPVMAVCR